MRSQNVQRCEAESAESGLADCRTLLPRKIISAVPARRNLQVRLTPPPDSHIEAGHRKCRLEYGLPERHAMCQRPGIVVGRRVWRSLFGVEVIHVHVAQALRHYVKRRG